MSKKQELIELYTKEMTTKLGIKDLDKELFEKVVTGCGPAIYGKDASTVSGSDEKELNTVKQNFLIKKLGLKDGPELDAAIKEVIEVFGSSNKNKYRAIFYYLLTKKFNKEAIYN